MITFGSCLFRKKKSILLLSSTIGSPWLILCAFTTISLSPACLKIFVSITTGKHFEAIMSFRTLPGPTLGSWFRSPTRIRRVPGTIAPSSAYISGRSTIDISSMIIASVSSGFSAFLPNPDGVSSSSGFPFTSSKRWIVCASYPVVSVILFAARPVGAASAISIPSLSKKWIIALMVVVFPVPGPPVSTIIPFLAASMTAFCCISSNCIPVFFSISWMRWRRTTSAISSLVFRSCSIFAVFSSI